MIDPRSDSYGHISFAGVSFCAFRGDAKFSRYCERISEMSAIPAECLWVLYAMARQSLKVPGDFWECGVDRGGSARLLSQIVHGSGKRLHLFDTFDGMPPTDPTVDDHRAGDFPGVPVDTVRAFVGHEDEVVFHPGLIPETFAEMDDFSRIAFAHIDVDIYESTKRCCEFIYPRLSWGGVIVFDDYGRPTCRGARIAIDEYFADKDSVPLSLLANGQALVFKI